MGNEDTARLKERIRELENQNEELQENFEALKKNEQKSREIGETLRSISNRFISAVDIDQAIHYSLADMGQLSGAGRTYLFLFSEDGQMMDNTHEWCAEGVKPEIDNLKNLPAQSFPWWMEQLRKGENIHIKNVSDMPEEANVEKEFLEAQDIKSLLVLPVYTGNQLKGFTGFDDVSKTGEWTGEHIKLLQSFSQIIINALERRQFENQLKEKTDLLENITHNIFDLVSLTDTEGNLIFAGKSFEKLGYEVESLIGTNILDYVHPEDYPHVAKEFRKFLQSNAGTKVEHRGIAADGVSLWFETLGKVLKDEDSNPQQLLFSSRDITDRKQAEFNLQKKNNELEATEKDLRESNDRLRNANQRLEEQKAELDIYKRMVEGSEDMMAAIDANYKYLCVNTAYLNYAQLNTEEMVGHNITDIIGKKYFEETVKPNLDKCLEGKTINFEVPIQSLENKELYFDNTYYPLRKDGKIDGIVAVVRDITEQKQAENELAKAKEKAEESEAKYRSLVENSDDAIFLLSNDKFEFINSKFEQMFGYTLEEINKPDFDIIRSIAPKDKSRVENALERLHKGENVEKRDEVTVFSKDGRQLDVEASVTHVPYKKGKAVQGIIRDITERKRTENELIKAKEKAEESDRLKSAFLANMSHEIRTPMNSIMGFSQMLQDREFSKEKRDRFLNIIHSRIRHLLNIINDLVDVSKIEANQLTLECQYFDLNDMMDELYSVYKNQLKIHEKTHQIELTVNKALEHSNSYIYSSPSRFRQIMDNLLSNAIKFTHEGTIEFGYEMQSENTLRFYVLDTGAGIPHDQQEHIFERFRRGSDATSQAYDGTGLGLTISKNLVELLGGEMWFGSKEGVGSVFYFTLPYETKSNSESAETQHKETDIADSADKTLLVIEDDPASREYMKELLEPHGFTLILSETGKDGYETFLNNPGIALILLDLKLPDMNGLDVIRKIRASSTNSEVPVIAQTAYAMSGDAQKSIEAGCNDYISKPIERNQLLGKINQCI